MSTPSTLHFGPTELARLAELARIATPADLEPVTTHWAEQSLSTYMRPFASPVRPAGSRVRTRLEADQLRSDFRVAIEARVKFCELFTRPAPFFNLAHSTTPTEAAAAVHLAR
jgi:hypothetical protein